MKCLPAFCSMGARRVAQACCSGGLSLTVLLGGSAIALTALVAAPPSAQAYTARVTLFVTRNTAESYDTFLRQCEAIARAGIQRTFDADLLTSEVIVTIIGENQGLALPIMEVQVRREQWQSRPDPQYWARYYNTASELLDM